MQYLKYLFCLSITTLCLPLQTPIAAQCNPNDQIESWYAWARDWQKYAVDFFPVSIQDENTIGDTLHLGVIKNVKLVDNSPHQQQLNTILSNITQHVKRKGIDYNLYILDNKVEANAFSLAGGNIYITKKMLKSLANTDELAFVIAHEVAHIDDQHGIRKIQKVMIGEYFLGDDGKMLAQLENIITAPFGQIDEYEADRSGAQLAIKAGYNPTNALGFFDRIAEAEQYDQYQKLIRTHPFATERHRCLEDQLLNNFYEHNK